MSVFRGGVLQLFYQFNCVCIFFLEFQFKIGQQVLKEKENNIFIIKK